MAHKLTPLYIHAQLTCSWYQFAFDFAHSLTEMETKRNETKKKVKSEERESVSFLTRKYYEQ